MNPTESYGSNSPQTPARAILVWDMPTRLFHWLLVMLVITSFVTGAIGGLWMQYHKLSGYCILGLLVFRLAWGFVGGQHARFSAFVRGPGAVLAYARNLLHSELPGHLGHNPLGGWSVLALLTTLLVQAGTGLFANDDIMTEGPLYPWVSKATSDWLTQIHLFNQGLILALVCVHVAAVLFYLIIKHDNLIRPMFTGRKYWPGEGLSSTNRVARAALIAGLCAAGVYLLVR
jgi:cytochrome b